jgi:hypothetical protein
MVLSALAIISIVLCLFTAALQAGYEHPIQTSDSKGNSLGFNNPLTWELYGILLKSASLTTIAHLLGWYGGIYLLLHLIALSIFAINPVPKANRFVASCFFLQMLISQFVFFPASLLGVIFLPFSIYDFFLGKIDGETITDWPFPFWVLFQTLWFVVSCTAGRLIWKHPKKAALNGTCEGLAAH